MNFGFFMSRWCAIGEEEVGDGSVRDKEHARSDKWSGEYNVMRAISTC
jgi:hypothetical protein